MAEAGQQIGSPAGMTLLFVKTGAETDGELLEMEATYSGDGGMPPLHLHPSQAEHFEILEGSMRTIVDGEERVYEAGESLDVPAGTPHQMGAQEPTRMRWEVRPAMRTAEFFERLYGDGPDSAQKMGEAFWAEFQAEFRLAES
jgi:mannose-6-phosphate isomerase-like protein (cupin superfamily)